MEASLGSGPVLTRYRNRDIRQADLDLIRAKVGEVGGQGRGAIARAICEAWDWRQPRGTLATRACSDLLLRLDEWGHIQLPGVGRRSGGDPRRSLPLLPDELVPLPWTEVHGGEVDLDSLVVRPIGDEERSGWQFYMRRYHYLGYRVIVGEHLLYAAYLQDSLVALLGWGSAAFRAPLREAYVGWSEATKRERLHLVADNVRFLVLPWVHVPHLASKILGANLRRLSADWEERWGHPIYLAETFVDTRRFRGTCYRASNWTHLGQTAGRTKRGNAYLREGSSKALFVYPLHRRARRLLGGEAVIDARATEVRTPPDQDADGQETSTPPQPSPVDSPSLTPIIPAHPAVAELPAEVPVSHTAPLAIIASVMMTLHAQAGSLQARPVRDNLADDQPEWHASPGDGCDAAADEPQTPEPRRSRSPIRIHLTSDERAILERQSRGQAVLHRTVLRSKIILLLAEGLAISAVARKLALDRDTVRKWGERFERLRLPGLEDAERSGRPARFSPRDCSRAGQACL